MEFKKITPFLMFSTGAEEAAKFYTSLFKDSKILSVTRGEKGVATAVDFQLHGQPFHAYNGGPYFKFSEGLSLFVSCEDQAEVDDLWNKFLADGGEPSQCGWLKDRWGVSWQIIPNALMRLMADKDPAKAGRVVQAMLKMGKIDVAGLQRAYDNG